MYSHNNLRKKIIHVYYPSNNDNNGSPMIHTLMGNKISANLSRTNPSRRSSQEHPNKTAHMRSRRINNGVSTVHS